MRARAWSLCGPAEAPGGRGGGGRCVCVCVWGGGGLRCIAACQHGGGQGGGGEREAGAGRVRPCTTVSSTGHPWAGAAPARPGWRRLGCAHVVRIVERFLKPFQLQCWTCLSRLSSWNCCLEGGKGGEGGGISLPLGATVLPLCCAAWSSPRDGRRRRDGAVPAPRQGAGAVGGGATVRRGRRQAFPGTREGRIHRCWISRVLRS